MRIEAKLERIGLSRLRVVKETGEYELLEGGRWARHKELADEYVPMSNKPSKYGQIYQLSLHGPETFAAIMPRKTARAMLRRHDFLKFNREADDCIEFLIPADRLDWKLCREMRLKYRRNYVPLSQERREAATKRLEAWHRKAKGQPPRAQNGPNLNESGEVHTSAGGMVKK